MDCSPPDCSLHGIPQARILEYLEYLEFPTPRGLPNPEIEPMSPALQADSLPSEPQGKPHTGVGWAPQPNMTDAL